VTRTAEDPTSLWRVPDVAGPDVADGRDLLARTAPYVAVPPRGPDTEAPTGPAVPFHHRHRVALRVCAALLVVLGGGVGAFAYLWNHSGPHELSVATAIQRFRSGATGQITDPGTLRPAAGVYSYAGKAVEHVSLPPKTQTEGPGFPVTITYQSDGCWTQRIDYSDAHWQSTTYCPRHGNLVEVGRAGWYRWNFVALVIADNSTYTCNSEMTIPAVLAVGQRFPLSCRGTNDPLHTGPVTMTGTNEYMGSTTLHVGAASVVAVHFREVARIGGGQTGTNVADTWFSTVDGLPVKGTWQTQVSTTSPLGISTMTANGHFVVASLTPLA